METIYIELDKAEDGPKLQEFCESVGIKRIYDNLPENGLYWHIFNNQLIRNYYKTDKVAISFEQLKKLYSKETSMQRFSVKIPNPEICEAIQKMSFKVGFRWQTEEKKNSIQYPDNEKLYFSEKDGHIYRAVGIESEYPELSLEEAVKKFSVPLKTILRIGGYTAKYDGDTVTLGCKKATKEELKRIMDKIALGAAFINGERVFLDHVNKQVTVGHDTATFDEIKALYEGF